jgi:hypothetical protein
MAGHVVHVAMATGLQPVQQVLLVLGKFEMCDPECRKTEFRGERVEFAPQGTQVCARHVASISGPVYSPRHPTGLR